MQYKSTKLLSGKPLKNVMEKSLNPESDITNRVSKKRGILRED